MTPTHLRVSVATLGCKLNQFESEAMLAQFRSAGYESTEDPETADVCVVNTCTVTATAERKARALLRAVRRRNSSARIVAAGCMAENSSEALLALNVADVIVGNGEKEHILDFLPAGPRAERAAVHVGETGRARTLAPSVPVDGLLGRSRGFVKVQDGCSQTCTYCIIPRVRGRGRSLETARVVEQARRLADCGFVEVVVTGVALGTYGRDLGLTDGLANLLPALASVSGLSRVRLGSVEPWAVTDRLLRIMADSGVICPHLHISVQSADDAILRLMNRPYTVSHLRRIFDEAFRLRDDWGFGADVIVGFPGEGEREFAATRRFAGEQPLSYLHVFPFSARPGTAAARMPGQVVAPAKKARVRELREVDQSLRLRFRQRHLGTIQRVLLEKRRVGSFLAGHATNYLDVCVNAPDAFAGSVRDVNITHLHPDGVVGQLLKYV